MTVLATERRPRFMIEPLPGEVERTIRRPVITPSRIEGKPPTLSWESVKVKEPAGFMAYFPAGHSFRVRNSEELADLGLDGDPYIDPLDQDNEAPPDIGPESLKEFVQSQARRNRANKRAAT